MAHFIEHMTFKGTQRRRASQITNGLECVGGDLNAFTTKQETVYYATVLKENFIEGMACKCGCIGGAGCLTHGEKNKAEVDKYGREAMEKTIADAVSMLK